MAITKLSTDVIDLSNNTEALTMPSGTTNSIVEVEYLVVAGGGGAGGGTGNSWGGGGGGAGGLLTATADFAISTALDVIVGSGGAGTASRSSSGTSGGNSTFATIVSDGGGGGGAENAAPLNGGSGGGTGGYLFGTSYSAGTGISGQGNDGGGLVASNGSGSGGGGAGTVGSSGPSSTLGGNGGTGVSNSITGTAVFYAGGGGAGSDQTSSGTGGSGGNGGGGDGGTDGVNNGDGNPGTANTGGGGGGGNTTPSSSATGGSGGSGVVILKYLTANTITISAGLTHSSTTSGLYSIVTFTVGTGTVSFADSGGTGRPSSPTEGLMRENTTTGKMEFYDGSLWQKINDTASTYGSGLIPSANFNTALYTGNGGADSVAVGFQPGLTWIKARDTSGKWNVWYDVQRGPTNMLSSNSEDAAITYGSVTPTTTGFDIGSGSAGDLNTNGEKYVSWNWKASDSFSYSASGSGNGSQIASAGYTNVAAGFSIVEYTGVISSSTSREVQHGLGGIPEIIISKEINRTNTRWIVRTQIIDNNPYSYLIFYTPGDSALRQLNTSDGTLNLPTATKFDINWNTSVGTSGYDIIAYCFRSIPGYSKIGFYVGNGSATGPIVYTGFKPAWLMVKRTDTTANWRIVDNKRNTTNPRNSVLYPNLTNAEYTDAVENVDFLTTGFQLGNSDSSWNALGGTYIYMTFAE